MGSAYFLFLPLFAVVTVVLLTLYFVTRDGKYLQWLGIAWAAVAILLLIMVTIFHQQN